MHWELVISAWKSHRKRDKSAPGLVPLWCLTAAADFWMHEHWSFSTELSVQSPVPTSHECSMKTQGLDLEAVFDAVGGRNFFLFFFYFFDWWVTSSEEVQGWWDFNDPPLYHTNDPENVRLLQPLIPPNIFQVIGNESDMNDDFKKRDVSLLDFLKRELITFRRRRLGSWSTATSF